MDVAALHPQPPIRQALIRNTPGPYSLFPGSFVYHPWFMDMGESQFMRLSPGPNMLWHPVKSK